MRKLSFVIPAYNEEILISKCLESILLQTKLWKEEIEIIVVNNASTDTTKKVAISFPAVIVVDEPQKGIVFARRAGFMKSTGDLIANIDADTLLPKGWIEKVFSEFSSNPKLVALSGPYYYYDMSKTYNFFIKFYYGLGVISHLINQYIFHSGAMLQGGNFVLKRDALIKIGGFDTSIEFYGEDTDIAKRIARVGEVKFTYKLPMFTSGRRLLTEGVLKMALKYSLNYTWITIFGRPFTKGYSDIRNSI